MANVGVECWHKPLKGDVRTILVSTDVSAERNLIHATSVVRICRRKTQQTLHGSFAVAARRSPSAQTAVMDGSSNAEAGMASSSAVCGFLHVPQNEICAYYQMIPLGDQGEFTTLV